jgi:hypothetical protein
MNDWDRTQLEYSEEREVPKGEPLHEEIFLDGGKFGRFGFEAAPFREGYQAEFAPRVRDSHEGRLGEIRGPRRPAPSSRGGRHRPTLADLHSFSQKYVRRVRSEKRAVDCADLAIELWIRFGELFRLPISFRIWNRAMSRWQVARRERFRSVDSFIRYVQNNLGALGLQDNTYNVPGGLRSAVAGDVFLWQWFHETPPHRRHRMGHTQIFDSVLRLGPLGQRIVVAQSTWPPAVPWFQTHPSAYFALPRRAWIGGQPHVGRVVGAGPRRFAGFRSLR